ncbi:FAD-binding protein [uncultured Rhodoblastus sp.]|uniref:FAD-binding protein n=1 Tax=uncultured Rhodoblastus sp. TaxID=543037 RepID=UPI0025D2F4FC|nr:FAD-binding protein [uncultured Rhodoblastus sp.]
MGVFQPSDEAQAAEIVAWAAAESQSLEIVAGASKRRLGRPPHADHRFDVSRLAGIVDYDPAELILTARAATPMVEIEAQLEARRQMLAFEPMDWRGLLGLENEPSGEPTLGGVLACNLGGPRRVRAGSARDYFLGFAAINGRGERWKAGGKVVKNVTGFDMCKLQAGAYGTLSVLTEVTLKVMPRPETAGTILLPSLSDEAAIAELSRALNTPFEVSAAAHLPAPAARRSGVAAVAQGHGAVTALRIEGPAPSVAFRADAIEKLFGRGARLDAAESGRLWREIGEARPLLGAGAACVWRLCPTSSLAPAVVSDLHEKFPLAEVFYDWGGGLIWLSLDAGEAGSDGGAARVRAAMTLAGGHSTLVVAPDAIRAAAPAFDPVEGALAALSKRVKTSFDPCGVFNPGRMQEGQ